LRAGQLIEPISDAPAELQNAIRAMVSFQEATNRARTDAMQVLASETARVGGVLRELVRGGRFREALTWQNRSALHRGLESLLNTPSGAADKETRKREMLVARYAQRYCVKNDTIGFFGPVGWGEFKPEGAAVELLAGASLVSKRTVYFEHWCIDALASKLAEDQELKPHMLVRRMPTVRVEGSTLHFPVDRTAPLSDDVARLLDACTGDKTAAEIAREVLADRTLDFTGEDEVYYRLQELAEQRLVAWTLEIPTGTSAPEAALFAQLSSMPASDARARALASLDVLEQRRADVAGASGDPSALDAALDRLETTFASLTGSAATRRGGETYAGRTLVYEDCRRDVELSLGPALRERLGPPLALLLQAARHYTYEIARRYRQTFRVIYEGLSGTVGSPRVDYIRYRDQVDRYFTEDQAAASHIVRDTVARMKDQWIDILGMSEKDRRVERSAADLAALVADRFAAPCPGWPAARYHSPDLLIAGADVDEIQRGNYLLVLGELHVSANTLLTHMALVQHDTPGELVIAREEDLPEPAIAPVESRQHTTRADHFSVSRHDFHLELGDTRSWRPRTQVIAVADLVVELVDRKLVVRTRDGSQSFDIVAFFEQYLMFASLGHFSIVPAWKHVPRVTVDGVVIMRETFRYSPAEIPFVHGDNVFERFAMARHWARCEGLPRFCFYKVPDEPKPCFVDFDSPVYVEMFAKVLAKASTVTVSEMLPNVRETWLTDREGRRYTSELRIAAVDSEPWRAEVD
jgi:hypothetical protein